MILGREHHRLLVEHARRHAEEMRGSELVPPVEVDGFYDADLWRAPLDGVWQRVFGWIDEERVVAACVLTGLGGITAHRCRMGLGVEESHRRLGIGRRLMREAIGWARGQPSLFWIDGEAMSANGAVLALDFSEGFYPVCDLRDSVRVRGKQLDVTFVALELRR